MPTGRRPPELDGEPSDPNRDRIRSQMSWALTVQHLITAKSESPDEGVGADDESEEAG